MPIRLPLVLVVLLGLTSPSITAAQGTSENAEARVYFEEGNRLYEQAGRAHGTQQTKLLQRSLEAYVDSLRIVRSRNALFNAAIVLGELGRNDESFNYFGEYLRIEELPPADREDATRRRDALRSEVAVLQVTTEPGGALLWVDRKDLAPRGETPIELALPAGEHRTFVEKDGFHSVEGMQTVVRGETVIMALPLLPVLVEPVVPEPVPELKPVEPSRPRLRNAAIGTAAGTLATAGVAIGLSIRASTLNDDHDRAAAEYRMTGDPADLQRAEDLADRTDRFNLTADVFWGTTIALGVSSIILYSLHRKKLRREAPEVGISVSRNAGFASVRMAFEAAQ
ncbi:MAG: PEGA domain-containing protein [Deltaproteobacteria bacterium]|nr:PEGA domain-containing protein [Deltaproteobacteria bacterium]MBW2627598.1 PEGA domain-containing protein [Deltaproteobacteria bacterium]MBW2685997.1 PEGA domain-containing protein [Deltaproteobacteria bacterium]